MVRERGRHGVTEKWHVCTSSSGYVVSAMLPGGVVEGWEWPGTTSGGTSASHTDCTIALA